MTKTVEDVALTTIINKCIRWGREGYTYMFTVGVRVCLTLSSWESSSAGIRDSRSAGNSRSVNSSTRGIEADLRQMESSFSKCVNLDKKGGGSIQLEQ